MSSADEYADKYMSGSKAVAHSRMRMPMWFHWLMVLAIIAAIGGAVGATLANPLSGIALWALVPIEVIIWLLFSHVRATVTEGHVHIQFGLFGPKIAIDKITKAAVERYDWKQYGGWGIKRARDGTWAYSVPGGKSDVLRVEYQDDKGKARKVVVSSDHAAELAQAINVRRLKTAARIDTTATEIDAEAMAEAEAAAAVEEESARAS